MWQFLPSSLVFLGAVLVAAGTYWTAFRQSNFNAQLRQKNEQIIELQREGVAASTGGDSFAIASFTIFGSDGVRPKANSMPDDLILQLVLINKGRFPLYDVSVRVSDLDKPFNINEALRSLPIGNMASGLAAVTPFTFPHHGKDIRLNIFFSARNGLWTQQLRMKWIGNGWVSASRVEQNGKEVYSEINERYPRTSDGQIEWEPRAVAEEKKKQTSPLP